MIFINGIIGKDVTLLGVVAAAKADKASRSCML